MIFFKPQDFHSTWKICQNQRLGVMFTLAVTKHKYPFRIEKKMRKALKPQK